MRRCRWCGAELSASGAAWADGSGDEVCESLVEGCAACDDGEAHPHEPAARTPNLPRKKAP